MSDKLVNAKEAAKWMGVSIVSFYRFRKEGMPYLKISRNCVRYDIIQIKSWLQERSSNMLESEKKNSV